jgi:BASS family bile acid:Na+ symporter
MSEFMQFIEVSFKPMVFIFTVVNLGALGLQSKWPELIAVFKNKKTMALIFVWGWVLGPALAYLITWIIPLAEPYVIVMLFSSVAPIAPFFPIMAKQARGDMSFAGALFPLAVVGTVIFLPIIGPLVIKGLSINPLDLAKPLFLTLLLPMAIGVAARHFAEKTVIKIVPTVNVIARIITLLMITQCFVIYAPEMLATAGSFALLSGTIFMVVMAVITYRIGFGLKQNQRSVMSLGMLQRNLGAILIAAFAIPNVDPLVITFTIMWGLWSAVLSVIAIRIFTRQAGKTVPKNTV